MAMPVTGAKTCLIPVFSKVRFIVKNSIKRIEQIKPDRRDPVSPINILAGDLLNL